jgi:SAM-dependent methyltransferase
MPEDKNIWEHFQNEAAEVFSGSEARLSFLASRFGAGEKVLNIGVGNGRLEELCLARGAEVYSVDPGSKTIDGLRARLGLGEKAAVGTSERIPFPENNFDAVVMSEVLEHIPPESMSASLDEVKRVLRPGGLFAGTVPCSERLSENETVCPKCGEKFHRWGHRQSFTPGALSTSLAGRFSSVSVEKKLFVTWRTLNWKGKLQGAFNYFLFFCGLLGDSRQNIYFNCKK